MSSAKPNDRWYYVFVDASYERVRDPGSQTVPSSLRWAAPLKQLAASIYEYGRIAARVDCGMKTSGAWGQTP